MAFSCLEAVYGGLTTVLGLTMVLAAIPGCSGEPAGSDDDGQADTSASSGTASGSGSMGTSLDGSLDGSTGDGMLPTDNPIEGVGEPVEIAAGFTFITAGLWLDDPGVLLFSDPEGDTLYQLTPPGDIVTYREPTNPPTGPNGLALAPGGGHYHGTVGWSHSVAVAARRHG